LACATSGIGPAVPDSDRLADESVGLGGLLGDGVDGVLQDFRSCLPQDGGYAERTDVPMLAALMDVDVPSRARLEFLGS
jgi:hypothetical protein